jgi:hypothetical protein
MQETNGPDSDRHVIQFFIFHMVPKCKQIVQTPERSNVSPQAVSDVAGGERSSRVVNVVG